MRFLIFVCAILFVAGFAEAKIRCLFLHGIGQKGPQVNVLPAQRPFDPNFMRKELTAYWGSLAKDVAPLCDARFYWTEAGRRGWDNKELQGEYCGAIAAFKPDVIFTHSMGNMIIAGAIADGVPGCTNIGQDANQIHWYGVQAPLRGSYVLNAVDKLCTIPGLDNIFPSKCDAKGGYATINKKYVSNTGKAQLFCNGSDKQITTNCVPLAWTASQKMVGSMCGFVPSRRQSLSDWNPLTKTMQQLTTAALVILAEAVHVAVPNAIDWNMKKMAYPNSGNDGMVGVGDCVLYTPGTLSSKRLYVQNPTAFNYALMGNHGDGTARFGDKKGDPALQPVAWFQNMIKHSSKTKGQPVFFELTQTIMEEGEEQTVEEQEEAEEEEQEEEEEAEEETLFIEEEEEEQEEEEQEEEEQEEEEEEQEEEEEVEEDEAEEEEEAEGEADF